MYTNLHKVASLSRLSVGLIGRLWKQSGSKVEAKSCLLPSLFLLIFNTILESMEAVEGKNLTLYRGYARENGSPRRNGQQSVRSLIGHFGIVPS